MTWQQTILFVAVFLSLFLNVFMAVRLYQTLGHIRRDSARAARIAEELRHEWDSFNRNQIEFTRRRFAEVEELAQRLEENTERRVRNLEELARRNREEVHVLQRFLHEVFEVELRSVFDSFDSTVGSILAEMREQLQRGVERVDRVQALVESRVATQQKMTKVKDELHRLLAGAPLPEKAGDAVPAATPPTSPADTKTDAAARA